MEFKKIILIIAIFMALSITLTMKIVDEENNNNNNNNATTPTRNLVFNEEKKIGLPSKRISRFLAEEKNPRAADHCNKDNDVCFNQVGSQQNATTCCNNKCIDLKTDNKNCGACKNKCKYTETCCRGQCVYLAYDKRHCGKCNSRCTTGSYCNYGMCDYA